MRLACLIIQEFRYYLHVKSIGFAIYNLVLPEFKSLTK
jgi:hypothetical protein